MKARKLIEILENYQDADIFILRKDESCKDVVFYEDLEFYMLDMRLDSSEKRIILVSRNL